MIDSTFAAKAQELVSDSLVWDNHACMPLRPHDATFLPQLERCRRAGVNVVSLNVGFGEHGVEEHVRMLALFRNWLSARRDDYVIAGSVLDIHQARASGRLAICFDIEGMRAIADQPDLVRLYYDLGVRWMLVAYNAANAAGSGCQDEGDGGLTEFGRAVIDEMARTGMVVCCSHTGYRTARDVIEYCAAPVIFSHSNPRALWDHPRNIPDNLMRACAAKGGVVGINGIGIFLGHNDNSTDAIVRHIGYALDLIGEDHVGLGLDYVFDARELDDYMSAMGGIFPPQMGYRRGMAMIEPERITAIAAGLLQSGRTPSTVRKVLGENFMRIAREVWR